MKSFLVVGGWVVAFLLGGILGGNGMFSPCEMFRLGLKPRLLHRAVYRVGIVAGCWQQPEMSNSAASEIHGPVRRVTEYEGGFERRFGKWEKTSEPRILSDKTFTKTGKIAELIVYTEEGKR